VRHFEGGGSPTLVSEVTAATAAAGGCGAATAEACGVDAGCAWHTALEVRD
jgi:hypothetical protein